jgi:hypothetical protein
MGVLSTVLELVEKTCLICCGLVAIIGTLFSMIGSLYLRKKIG